MSILKTISKEDVKFLMDFDYNNVLGRLKFILGDKASFFADVRVKQKEVTWSTRDDREFCCYSDASDTEKKILRDKVNEHIGTVSAIISGDSLVGPYTEQIVSYPSNYYIYYIVENNNYNIILTGWGCGKTERDIENIECDIFSDDIDENETSFDEQSKSVTENHCPENKEPIVHDVEIITLPNTGMTSNVFVEENDVNFGVSTTDNSKPGTEAEMNESETPRPPKPESHMVLALICTLLCLPFGIVAIVNAVKVDSLYYDKNFEGAEEASENTRKWAKRGFCLWGALVFIWIIIIIIAVANS